MNWAGTVLGYPALQQSMLPTAPLDHRHIGIAVYKLNTQDDLSLGCQLSLFKEHIYTYLQVSNYT